MNEYKIKTKEFEGPFDILLEKIQQKKVSINNISLAELTDEYINYVKKNETSLKNATIFIWTAATLMLIKSKSLLPKLYLHKDDEYDISELKQRLRFLKEIKETSKHIKDIFGKNIFYKKIYKKKIETKFRPDESITLKNILISLDSLVVRSPLVEKLPDVSVKKQKTLKEVMEEVSEKITMFMKINFSEISRGKNKSEISVSFLAILELFRNGEIGLTQNENFGNIEINKK